MKKQGLGFLGLALVALSAVVVGCDLQKTVGGPYSVDVTEALYVVPESSLPTVMAGGVDASLYSGANADPFLDKTYLVQGSQHLETRLAVYNSAPLGGNFLTRDHNGQLVVKGDLNDITDLKLVVEVKNCQVPFNMTVNGQALTAADFVNDDVELSNGDLLYAGGRLPGWRAIVSLGELKASSSKTFDVTIDAECEFTVHFDVFGDALCDQIFVNSADNGTTLSLYNEACEVRYVHLKLYRDCTCGGSGTVLSSVPGLVCDIVDGIWSCEGDFPVGTEFTLTPIPDPGSSFEGWEFGTPCAPFGQACSFTLNDDLSMRLYFKGLQQAEASQAFGTACPATTH